MMNYLITVVVAILALIFLIASIRSLFDLRMMVKENQRRSILYLCTLYVDIFAELIKNESFLRMKNSGNNLCSDITDIQYIKYNFENLFM